MKYVIVRLKDAKTGEIKLDVFGPFEGITSATRVADRLDKNPEDHGIYRVRPMNPSSDLVP